MQIGLVIDDLDRRRGGMSEWCWQFVNALSRRGIEAHVVAQGFGEEALPKSVVRHIAPRSRSRIEFAAAAERMLRQANVDVAHDMGMGWHFDLFQPHGGSYLAWMSRRLDMYPKFFRAIKRPIDALLPRRRDFAQHWARQCAAIEKSEATIVAVSHEVARHFEELNHIRHDRIAVIHNGVDCTRFSPAHRAGFRGPVRRRLGIADDTLLLLIAAHNFRLKGVPELLWVTAQLVKAGRPVHTIVAGGQHLEPWRLAAARLGVSRQVSFVGSVANMVPYFAAADAYVHPTYYDPCSLVLLEAAASGLPIVTTRRFNGAAELFHEDDDILTVNDPREYSALLERVDALFDERLRGKLSVAARRVALRNPLERNVAEIVRLYASRTRRGAAA